MRSATELRQRWLEELPRVMARPGMWARDGREMETVASTLLRELCFVDERDGDYDEVRTVPAGFGKLGVHGPFAALFGNEPSCAAEVASVFAEQFHRLGYLAVDRLLDPTEWTGVLTGLHERFADRDVCRSEVVAEFGPPSLMIDQRVLCYAPDDPTAGWVVVDCFDQPRTEYEPGAGRYRWRRDDDPLVRDVRRPAEDFERGLILTLFGNVLRWGPGWWVRHPGDGASEQTLAIAAQLRDIEARDPSQSLKGHPPHWWEFGRVRPR